tara:strand:- start:451 stop:738 length:288 start_codon:yes stop_codon:yes gene_type:complete
MKTRDDKMASNTWNNRNCGEDGKIRLSYLKPLNDYAEWKKQFLDSKKNWVDAKYAAYRDKMMMCWCRGYPELHKHQNAPLDKCNLPVEEDEDNDN